MDQLFEIVSFEEMAGDLERRGSLEKRETREKEKEKEKTDEKRREKGRRIFHRGTFFRGMRRTDADGGERTDYSNKIVLLGSSV